MNPATAQQRQNQQRGRTAGFIGESFADERKTGLYHLPGSGKPLRRTLSCNGRRTCETIRRMPGITPPSSRYSHVMTLAAALHECPQDRPMLQMERSGKPRTGSRPVSPRSRRVSPLGRRFSTANITMQFGAKPLFENVSVKFGNGNRYGLIGANGCGKSTFMKISATTWSRAPARSCWNPTCAWASCARTSSPTRTSASSIR